MIVLCVVKNMKKCLRFFSKILKVCFSIPKNLLFDVFDTFVLKFVDLRLFEIGLAAWFIA